MRSDSLKVKLVFKLLIPKLLKKQTQMSMSTSEPFITFQEICLPYISQEDKKVEYKSSEFVIQSRFQNARYLPTYIVLYGETFAGKTQILKNYYNRAPHRNSQQYAAKYWFDAGSKERLVEQYKDMLEENETSTKNLSENKIIKKAKSFLKKQNNCLLVFDNAVSEEILKKFRPAEGNVHVLISSRDANWPSGTYQKIEVPHFIPEKKNFIHEREAFQRIEHSRKKENYLLLKTSNILRNLKKGTVSIADEMLLHYLEFLVNLYDSINMKSKVNKKLLINNMSDIAMHLSLFYMTKTVDIEKQQHYLNLSKRLFSQLEDNISELYTEISIIGGQVGWNTSGPYSEQSKQLETLNKKFNKITLSGNKSERKNTSITKEMGLALVNFLSTNIDIKNQLVGSKDEVTSITVDISNLENRLKNLTYLNLLDKNHPLSKRYEVEVAIGKLSLGSTLLFSDDN
ncbi:MAG: hypothetical protein K0S11_1694, partial [Gammaproteobacteria bacterium]|nr:hypothetical protein [Gammaproteobacteria bacterium]